MIARTQRGTARPGYDVGWMEMRSAALCRQLLGPGVDESAAGHLRTTWVTR